MGDKRDNLVNPLNYPEEVRKANASKGGRASAEKRKRLKSTKEALEAILAEPIAKGSKVTKLEGISIKVVKKMFDDPDIRDLETLAKIRGEIKQQNELTGPGGKPLMPATQIDIAQLTEEQRGILLSIGETIVNDTGH